MALERHIDAGVTGVVEIRVRVFAASTRRFAARQLPVLRIHEPHASQQRLQRLTSNSLPT